MARPQECARLVQAMIGHDQNRLYYDKLLQENLAEPLAKGTCSRTPIRIRLGYVEASRYLCRILRDRAALYRDYSARGQTHRRIRHHAEHSFSPVAVWSVQGEGLLAHNHRR